MVPSALKINKQANPRVVEEGHTKIVKKYEKNKTTIMWIYIEICSTVSMHMHAAICIK